MNTFSDFFPLFPEIFLLCATCLVLLIDMFLPDSRRNITYWLSLVTLVVTGVMSLGQLSSGFTAAIFNHMFTVDPLANLFKLASVIAVGVTFVYSRTYIVQRGLANDTLGGEFYPLALFSLLGMFVMISGTNFLTLYLGLELMSLASYALVALARDNSRSIEASMKYFVLGALASGFLLYGMSMLYGAGRTVAADADCVGRPVPDYRKCDSNRANQHQAHACLFDHFPYGLHAVGVACGYR